MRRSASLQKSLHPSGRLADAPTAVVLDDVRIVWDIPDLKPHGPDIMVIFGVRARKNLEYL